MTPFGSPIAITVAELGSDAETQQVCPKTVLWMFGDPEVAFRGFSQLAWLRRLKNSARNWSLRRSGTSKFLSRPESKFQTFGPCTMLGPLPFRPGGGMRRSVSVTVP